MEKRGGRASIKVGNEKGGRGKEKGVRWELG